MEPKLLTGAGAGSAKYDVLTALSIVGLSGPPTLQTSMMRLIALVTARYNWRTDEVCIGQRDMARMWSVNERTVKREMKRLTHAGLLICTRVGVKGRVGAFRLNHRRIAELSASSWSLVGPDFEARMSDRHPMGGVKVIQLSNYSESKETPKPDGETPWSRTMARLSEEHPSAFGSWFSRLSFLGYGAGTLTLKAPSAFIQRYVETHLLDILLASVEQEFKPVDRIDFAK